MLLLSNFFRWTKLRKLGNCYQPESGFTLIELLMVTIIVGILSSLAISAVFGQVQKAKEVEAVSRIGEINRLQQAKYQERNDFAKSLTELEFPIQETSNAIASPLDVLGIESQQTENFIYGTYSFEFDGKPLAINFAISKQADINSFVGAVLGTDNAVNTCKPNKIEANLKSSYAQVLLTIGKIMSNPSKYCPELF